MTKQSEMRKKVIKRTLMTPLDYLIEAQKEKIMKEQEDD